MAKQEEPLNEVSLNTPASKYNGLFMLEATKIQAHNCDKENMNGNEGVKCVEDIKYRLEQISKYLKQQHCSKEEVRKCFREVYEELRRGHALSHLRSLAKQHLAFIVALLNMNQLLEALEEVICLYNETNLIQVEDLGGIILADYSSSNEYYLSTLKILTLQIILKTNTANAHKDSLVLLFSLDRRYLLRDPKVKIHTLVKMLLNFYTLLPDLKVLFGLKFLQYTKQFNLLFETYIKNISQQVFESQLIEYAYTQRSSLTAHFQSFFSQYALITGSRESISIEDFTNMGSFHSNEKANLEHLLELKSLPSNLNVLNQDIEAILQLAEECLLIKDIAKASVIQLMNLLWHRIRLSGLTSSKSKLQLIDKSLRFLNSSIKDVEDANETLLRVLNTLSECCFDILDFKRLSNITNVLFNSFVILRDFKFIQLAANIESRRFLINCDQSQKNTKRIAEKFAKFISNIPDQQRKLQIFSLMFNVHLMHSDESLAHLQSICQYVHVKCYQKLKTNRWVNFERCSEVMLAFFYGPSKLKVETDANLSPMVSMLYSCLSGQISLDSMNVNPRPNKWHILYKFEVLLKVSYCFYLDMAKHSTSNLASIVKIYTGKWISGLCELHDTISPLEIEFLRELLIYLDFNNFDKPLLELIGSIKTQEDYFKPLVFVIESHQLKSSVNLQMIEEIAAMKKHFISKYDPLALPLEDLLQYLESRLALFMWENNSNEFEDLMITKIPQFRPEIYDINNASRMPTSTYVKILLFNVDLFVTAAKLHLSINDMIGAVIESKKALKLALSLMKKLERLSQGSKLKLIRYLMQSYMCLIDIYLHIGVSKDSEFYVKELVRVVCELRDPTILFDCFTFLYRYYSLTGQKDLKATVLKKSNKTFDHIDGNSNILALTLFFFINNEREKIFESLKLFFADKIHKTFLPQSWMLELGDVIQEIDCPCRFKTKNRINSISFQYKSILNSIENDPFFKNVFESLLVIPSSFLPSSGVAQDLNNKSLYQTPCKGSPQKRLSPSSKPSNMTPRGKTVRQKFDRAAAVNSLERLKKSIKNLEMSSLKNEDLSKVSSLYSLTLTLLGNLCTTPTSNNDLFEGFALSELPKSLPLLYDKKLNAIGEEIYDSYNLLPMSNSDDTISEEKESLLQAQNDIGSIKTFFNIISMDICPLTENLILSRTDSLSNRKVHLRVPLNRGFTRDLDSLNLRFQDAKEELLDIMHESNATTSIEVTNSITSREGRKKWWDTRHDLDHRLDQFLSKVENSWFNSLKGFFSDEIIEDDLLREFRISLNKILHENLPSRKQWRSPDSFLQIEDWIIEWIMKLNPQDTNFVSMVEDLLYFVLDIFLFHGEENAYDEIDFDVMHIKLEEHIRKFRTQVVNSKKSKHTFLIVSGALHIFPWECFSFFKSLSMTRVPSYSCLNNLLKGHNYEVFPRVSLANGISMVLNPNGDLCKTESRFSELFRNIARSTPKSTLIINEKPSERLYLQSLATSKLFIYLGHGGGEQFARLKEIKKLKSIAPSFLLGCSSAFMADFGRLEPTGTVYAYLLGGCPLVVGNLWDVTDKDIDKFSDHLFKSIGLINKNHSVEEESNEQCISKAVCKSREACYLKYLNGAAPVAYGLPIKFT